MKTKLIALILGMVLMMAPASASAIFYTDRAQWEAAVVAFADVTLPSNNLAQYQALALPSGGGDVFNINVPLTNSGDFYYTNTTAVNNSGVTYYYANGSFYNMPNGWTFNTLYASAFGFDMVPAVSGNVIINLYTQQAGELSQIVNLSSGAEFFGWVGDNVNSFSTYSFSGSYGLGNFVQGVEGGASPVPEPATLLLLGSGLLGLVGFRRMRK